MQVPSVCRLLLLCAICRFKLHIGCLLLTSETCQVNSPVALSSTAQSQHSAWVKCQQQAYVQRSLKHELSSGVLPNILITCKKCTLSEVLLLLKYLITSVSLLCFISFWSDTLWLLDCYLQMSTWDFWKFWVFWVIIDYKHLISKSREKLTD